MAVVIGALLKDLVDKQIVAELILRLLIDVCLSLGGCFVLFAGAFPGSNSLTLSESFLILRFYSLQTYSNGAVINKNISGYLRRRRLKFIDDLFILLMSLKITGQMYYSRFLSEISTI